MEGAVIVNDQPSLGFMIFLEMAQNYEKLMNKTHCGADAVSWLKTAVDPFHDYDVAISGIPDNDSQPSVVQVIPYTTTISAPPNLGVDETWSVQFVTLPVANQVFGGSFFVVDESGVGPATDSTRRNYDGSQFYEVGTVTVIRHGDSDVGQRAQAWPASTTTVEEDAFGDSSRVSSGIAMDIGGDQGVKKLIAGGFEVHNDTAALYKQGSVTVFQSSQFDAPEGLHTYATATAEVTYRTGARSFRQPPVNRLEAAGYPTSRTWEAADGCYVPIRLGDSTHYQGAQGVQYHHARFNQTKGYNTGFSSTFSGPAAAFAKDYAGKFRHCDIETTGAYFSGLSPQTVLTLTVKFVVEVAPTTANNELIFMMSPTPEYCPKAIEMYHATMRSLPPGVPVGYNAKGDWYRMATKVLNSVAPAIMPMIAAASPTAATIAGAALSANNAIAKATEQKRNKDKKTAPQQSPKATSRPNRAQVARLVR